MGNVQESNPLLGKQEEEEKQTTTTTTAGEKDSPPEVVAAEPVKQQQQGEEEEAAETVPMGWTAAGLPMPEHIMRRATWGSGLCACFGQNDEFCSSDLEVCLVGSVAPCVLYGSNAERLEAFPGAFSNHCLPYTGLYAFGNALFGWNCMAPLFSYPSRTAIRRKFNLEGNCESLTRSCGCCGSSWEDEVQREQCESVCDLTTHVFCHPCALCQESREVRRRLPHPALNTQPILVMIPPSGQAMGREARV